MENQKKILYLVTQSEFGGAQKYIFDLACSLDKHNFAVEVGVGRPGVEKWLRDLEEINIKVWRLKHVARSINPWHNTASIFELFKLIKKTNPDIVHLNSSMIGFTGAIAAKLAGVEKIIYTVHGLTLNDPWPVFYKTIFWLFEWLGNLITNKIICVSHFDKKSVLKLKLAPSNKITVIANGLDLTKIEFLAKDKAQAKILFNLKVPKDHKLIGFIGYFYPTKGLRYLISAASQIVDKRNDVNFILIGKGQQKEMLAKMVKKYQLAKKVIFAGEVLGASKYLPAFDIFVLPSVKEGLSYTLIEALASGTPIVTTDVGGNTEIVADNKNGLIVPPANPQALAEAINKILSNPDLVQKFTINNQEKIKQFDLNRMVKETEKIYT